MNVAFTIDRNYLPLCMIVISSIIKNNANSTLNFYIVHNNCISQENLNNFLNNINCFKTYKNFNIELVDISTHKMFSIINHPFKHWTPEVNFKMLFPSIFNNLDKLLLLDCDIIIKNNISEFYNTDISNYLFMGDNLTYKNTNTICAGVLLMNLKLARETDMQNELITYWRNHTTTEEMCINEIYQDKILYTSKHIYTVSGKRIKKPSRSEYKNIILIHYVGRKPWLMSPFRRFGINSTKIWWFYAKEFANPKYKLRFNLLAFYTIYIARFFYSFTRILSKLITSLRKKLVNVKQFSFNKLYKYLLIK